MKRRDDPHGSDSSGRNYLDDGLAVLLDVALAAAPVLLGFIIIMGLFAPVVRAADNIDREYTAVIQAYRALQSGVGCSNYSPTFSRGYTVGSLTKYGTNKQDVVYVTGYQLRIACTEYLAKPPTWNPPVVPSEPEKDDKAQLSWMAPTTRTNGAALPPDQIAGYHVFRYQDGEFVKIGEVGKPAGGVAGTAYVDEDLAPGTYRYVLKTIDSAGLPSAFSAEVSVTIQ